MSGQVICNDYPEHLNPFDENYDPVASAPVAPTRANSIRQKYNTWTSNRHLQVVVKQQKPTFLEKPWAALNISPKGKLVRRLSVLKTAVERFATKNKKKLERKGSYRESSLPPRSNSLHEDFNYRIISPKIKEKIRQQVFSRSISTPEREETESREEDSPSPQINGQLTLELKLDSKTQIKVDDCSPTSPESEKDGSQLGARPKTRKKRPPPPPPIEPTKQINLFQDTNGQDRSDDSISANSSITQELEKDAATDDDFSLIELDHQSNKPGDNNR